MKLIIFDTRYNYKETLRGAYDNGTFKYKDGLFSAEKTFPIVIDYNNLYQLPKEKEKVAFAQYDGQNYKQISLDAAQNTINADIKAFIKDFEIAHYTKESMLQKPQDYNEIIRWLLVIIVLALAVLAYFTSQNAYKVSKLNYAALNTTLQAYTLQMKLQNYLIMRQFNITANLSQIAKMPLSSIK
jgi:hypothetical protein